MFSKIKENAKVANIPCILDTYPGKKNEHTKEYITQPMVDLSQLLLQIV
jgi:hypothetical protein